MLYLTIMVSMICITVILITYLKIDSKNSNKELESKKYTPPKKKINCNFSNPLTPYRNEAFDKRFKNKDNLYEPIKVNSGIKIKDFEGDK